MVFKEADYEGVLGKMSEMKQIDQLWILPTEAGYKIGLTAEAQEDLGKITFATFPKVGQTLAKGDSLIELEAEKKQSVNSVVHYLVK